jgi:hypothetical protein
MPETAESYACPKQADGEGVRRESDRCLFIVAGIRPYETLDDGQMTVGAALFHA